MSLSVSPARGSGHIVTAEGMALFPGLILCAALLFNAFLAIVNAQVAPLPGAAVIAAEIAIVAGIHVMAIMAFRPQMRPWYALVAFLVLIAAYRSVATGTFDVKFLRDGLLVPTLILLGMTFRPRDLVRWILVIHGVVLAFMLMEALFTDAFAQLFDIRGYYINTRGYEATDFWNTESSLYVSASRPNERIFLNFLNLHRVSSVFLEPVSLGNYCVVVTGFICAFYRHLRAFPRAFLIAGNVALIIACDGRLAFVCSVLIIAACLVARGLPRRLPFLYLPLAVVGAFLLVELAGFSPGGDDFPGRIAHTVDLLSRYGPADFLGLSDEHLSEAVDSGVSYLVITQSIVGLVIIWSFIALAASEETLEQKRFLHATCLYLALNMLVSFAFLTIKTAALLWAIYGVLQVRGVPSAEDADRG